MTQDNRSSILQAALELFAARGYDAVAVQEIVEAAGITKPTLYHYFGSKQGVLQALMDEYSGELLEAIRQGAEYHGDLVMNLRQVVRAYFDFARAHPVFYRLLFSMRHGPPESQAGQIAAQFSRQVYTVIEALFAEALPHFAERQRRYAVTFTGMIDMYIALTLKGHTEPSDDLVYDAVHQFMYGIYS